RPLYSPRGTADAGHQARLRGPPRVLRHRRPRREPQPVALVDLEEDDAQHHERHLLRHALPLADGGGDERVARTLDHLLHGELLRVELARVLTPVAGIALCGERPDEDHVALADVVATTRPVLQAAANRHWT